MKARRSRCHLRANRLLLAMMYLVAVFILIWPLVCIADYSIARSY
ncbi:unnamed protein product [Amoebophrya sp. A120]|nr:unnamed protein product [Amoebophrya sp. A120]|eukprot:GSA120T00009988001.1